MKIATKEQVTIEQLKEKLVQQFPDYEVSNRNKNILVVKKTGTAAALVLVGKGKLSVNEGFATMGGQMAFTLSLLLLGILIPLVVYFIAFFPKQKAVRTEVSDFVKMEYGVVA